MKSFNELTKLEIEENYKKEKEIYDNYCKMNLNLNIARGKPNAEQLDISNELLSVSLTSEDYIKNGVDYRNYGILDGLPETKKLFSEILNIPDSYIFVGGNSSLNLMFDMLSRAMLFGLKKSLKPWCK